MRMVVILAGGKGKRLWPLSRESRPKQFLKLGRKSLLQETFERSSSFVSPDRIYVVTNKKFHNLTKKEIGIPEKNIIGEPYARNTAPAIGLAAIILSTLDEKGIMVALPADHKIGEKEAFLSCLEDATAIASSGEYLVTLGILPTFPATGYGYIKGSKPLSIPQVNLENGAFHVDNFTEKPDEETAQRFLQEGSYFWNSGMFIFRADKILGEIEDYLPDLYEKLEKIKDHLPKEDRDQIIEQAYRDLPSVSIDHGIMEKTTDAAVIPASFGWNDVGDWTQVSNLMEKDQDSNAVNAKQVGKDTKDSIIYSEKRDKLIATLGVDGLVIVDTEEALLVMDKSRSQELKEIVKKANNHD